MKLTYQDLLEDPNLVARLHAQARRERADAAERLLLAPLKRLLAPRAAPLARPGSLVQIEVTAAK